MDRWLSRVVAIAVIGFAAYLAYRSAPTRTPIVTVVTAEDAGTDGASPAASSASTDDAGAPVEAGLFLTDLTDLAPLDAGVGALGANAPRQVHLGVVIVTFQGAQGAPPTARSKQDARALADRLAADAKSDFHGAVQRGDNGSSDDIGRIPRGVLEPALEVGVFTLAPGAVSDVLETPRGFWIAKRID